MARARDGKRIFGNVKDVTKTKLSEDPLKNGGWKNFSLI